MLSGVEASFASEDCFPVKPSPPRLVNNLSKEFPDFISASEEQALEGKLEAFSKETSNQIVIVIVDDLCGYDANEFSTRLGENWGVGQGKFDNGLVVMIKPTGGSGQRDAYIAVGRGLEGIIPDAIANRILDQEIIPRFKNGENYSALESATNILISLAKKEYSYQDYGNQGQENWWPFIIAVIIIVTLTFLSIKRRGYTMTSGGRTYHGGGWSSWGGGGFGGGGFGGGGGGGFGGFGGGGFGGGGAGGHW
jgi:uncharacterized protein